MNVFRWVFLFYVYRCPGWSGRTELVATAVGGATGAAAAGTGAAAAVPRPTGDADAAHGLPGHVLGAAAADAAADSSADAGRFRHASARHLSGWVAV